MIETHLIETFVEVVRHGSVTAGARALGKSQPAVSLRLKQLDESVGTPLFQRVGRGVMLTAAGERFHDEAVTILSRLRALPGRVAAEEAATGMVVIGATALLERYLLGPAIRASLAEHAGLKLVVRHATTDELRGLLIRGEVDVVVSARALEGRGITSEPLRTWKAVVVGQAVSSTRVDDLRAMRLLSWPQGADPILEPLRQWAVARDLVDATTPELTDVGTLVDLASGGVGYALLPDFVGQDESVAIGALPLVGLRRSFPLYLSARTGLVEETPSAIVRDLVLEECG